MSSINPKPIQSVKNQTSSFGWVINPTERLALNCILWSLGCHCEEDGRLIRLEDGEEATKAKRDKVLAAAVPAALIYLSRQARCSAALEQGKVRIGSNMDALAPADRKALADRLMLAPSKIEPGSIALLLGKTKRYMASRYPEYRRNCNMPLYGELLLGSGLYEEGENKRVFLVSALEIEKLVRAEWKAKAEALEAEMEISA